MFVPLRSCGERRTNDGMTRVRANRSWPAAPPSSIGPTIDEAGEWNDGRLLKKGDAAIDSASSAHESPTAERRVLRRDDRGRSSGFRAKEP